MKLTDWLVVVTEQKINIKLILCTLLLLRIAHIGDVQKKKNFYWTWFIQVNVRKKKKGKIIHVVYGRWKKNTKNLESVGPPSYAMKCKKEKTNYLQKNQNLCIHCIWIMSVYWNAIFHDSANFDTCFSLFSFIWN